ncbi:MAG: site-specific integrase [Smithella sp.]
MKRFRGEGTVAFNPNRNNYEARFSYIDPATGQTKRKSFSGKTAQEALRRGKRWKVDVDQGLLPNRESCTVWEWMDFWLRNYQEQTVKPKAYDKCESSLRCYVKPRLGAMPIRKLTGIQVQQLLNDLLQTGGRKGAGLSTSTVNGTRKYLRAAFDQAAKNGIVKTNVVAGTVAIRQVKKGIRVLTVEEAKALVDAAKTFKADIYGKVPYMLLSLALDTGMRLGELIALRWNCVDLIKSRIYVKYSTNSSKPSLKLDETKTKQSVRQVALFQRTIQDLRAYQSWQEAQKEVLGDKYHDHGLVITNIFGGILSPANFSRRVFKPLLCQTGIGTDVRFHDLRHTHASHLLAAGVNPKVIQERLGHSTIAMTLNTYSHLMPNMQAEEIKKVELEMKI